MHKEILILTEKRTEGFYLNRLLLMQGAGVCNAYTIDDAKGRIRDREVSLILTTMDTSTLSDVKVPVEKVSLPVSERTLTAVVSRCFSPSQLRPAIYRDLLPYWLYENCSDVDLCQGLANCGSAEGYLAALDIFYGSINSKADEIEDYYKNADMENYNIKVHALKSSARTIGAEGMADLAASMEAASAARDEKAVFDRTEELLDWFRSYRERLSGLSADSAEPVELMELPEGYLDRAYTDIARYADQMDYALCEETITALLGFEMPEEDRTAVSAMMSALEELNWGRIRQLLGERRGS